MGNFARLNPGHNGKDQQPEFRAAYSGLQMDLRCVAICLIAIYAAFSNQERSASRDAKYCVSTRGAALVHAIANHLMLIRDDKSVACCGLCRIVCGA
jgi:NAD-dependent dihydropyrimidine dehydrogenase PreA subunit